MHDAAYKLIFARPRMIRDLLDGFAARGWSDTLDFDTLEPVPASFDLQQRHGDLVWRIRFRGVHWLYLLLLLEFQAGGDPAMAAHMLAYTTLLYQRLDADGALPGHGLLPPVLPVVFYNGRRRWTAPVEMADLVAARGGLLAPYRPSQRYYLLDVARTSDADLPPDNLVSALVGLEKARDAARLGGALKLLIDLLRAAGDDHLTRAFATWLRQGLRLADRPAADRAGAAGGVAGDPDDALEENVQEWTREWLEQGRAQGTSRNPAGRRASSRAGRRASSRAGRRASSRAGSSRGATRSGRCSAVWRRGSSTPPRRRGWPPPWPGSRTRSGSGGSATGSSSARRRRSFSPASAATAGRAVDHAAEPSSPSPRERHGS